MTPEGWRRVQLGDLVRGQLQNGLYKEAKFYGEGVQIVRINDFGNSGKFSTPAEGFERVRVTSQEQERFSLLADDILINRVNSLTHIGKSVIIGSGVGDSVFESNMIRVRLENPNLSPKYLSYLLLLPSTRNHFSRVAKKAVAQASINQRDVETLEVELPTISEQHTIVAILATWDLAISKLETLVRLKELRKRGLMQQLLTGKKRFEEFKATSWSEVPLESTLSEIVGGGTPSRNRPEFWTDDGIPWVTVKDLRRPLIHGADEHITDLGLRNSASNLIQSGTVIISTRMAVGRTVRSTVPVAINQDLKALFPKPIIDPAFLQYALIAQEEQIGALGSGSTVRGIRLADLKKVLIGVPQLEEQRRIVSVLAVADAEIDALQRQLELYKEQKRGLMQQLLTGKKRVKVGQEAELLPA